MIQKRAFAVFSIVFVIVSFCADLAMAQMIPLYRFKGVNLPVKLKVKDKSIDKGAYDIEFLRTSSPVLYYIKFMKKGKILEVLQGEEWPYAHGIASDAATDRSVPTSPTLKMSKNTSDKLLIFVFESSRNALNYPLIRARFKIPYEE
jgi:hypothetical protein